MTIAFSKTRWLQIDSILDCILDQPQDQQLEHLRSICGDDTFLYSEVKSLLQVEKQAPEYLEHPAVELAESCLKHQLNDIESGEPIPDLKNSRVGSYILKDEIGRGGMGVVYRAERTEGGFDQQVAIKLLWSDKHRYEVVDRFHRERQMLASLIHPNIAQLYDGGISAGGRPYFVMEYVSGEPLDRYCGRKCLNVEERLHLLLQIMDALAFAHQHLIVHRDIKPSNILVTEYGRIKLLDFGIAKLLGNNKNYNLTCTGEQLMTPGYAAPEQLKNKSITIGTDVYQLGLVAYELLTGRQAFSDQADSFADLISCVCEGEPTLPSVMFSKSNLTSKNIIAKCQPVENNLSIFSNKHWTKKLKGDLDAILLKMLQNDTQNRYPSMEILKTDLKAYFDNQPVSAQKSSLLYQTKKFIHRRWRAISVVSIFMVLFNIYVATTIWQAQEIQRALEKSEQEKNKAKRVSEFLVNVFKAADPNVAGLDTITAQTLLDKGRMRIVEELKKVPAIQAHMLSLLGEIYFSQGKVSRSAELLEQALLKQQHADTKNQYDIADIMTQLGISYSFSGRYEEAESLFKKSIAIHTNMVVDNTVKTAEYAETLVAYGGLKQKVGDYGKAVNLLREGISILQPMNNDKHGELATAFNNLAIINHIKGEFNLARENMQKAMKIQKTVLGEEHSYYSIHLKNFALMLTDMEMFEEAEAHAQQALSLQQTLLDGKHPYISGTMQTLGVLNYRRGQLKEAESYLRRVVTLQESESENSTISLAISYMWLGAALQDRGNYAEASFYYAKMIKIFREISRGGDIIGRGLCQIASLAYAQGDLEKAKNIYMDALEMMPGDGIRRTFAQVGYGQILLETGELEKAEQVLRSALRLRSKKFPQHHSMIAESRVLLGLALSKTMNTEEAFQLLTLGMAELKKHALFNHGNRHRILTQGQAALSALSLN